MYNYILNNYNLLINLIKRKYKLNKVYKPKYNDLNDEIILYFLKKLKNSNIKTHLLELDFLKLVKKYSLFKG
jgi:hypothetical protein